jgi:PIN domain nuclease of toxin-antitoxin system
LSKAVLDASAVIAYLQDEPGADVVDVALRDGSWISSVNLAEVASKLVDFGYPPEEIDSILRYTNLSVVDFDREAAVAAGLLRTSTRQKGLSLGDRACLALAREMRLPALTADRNWLTLDVGVSFELCR